MDSQLPYGDLALKAGCLPYAVGKQPSIPLINLGRKMDSKMMMIDDDDRD